MEEAKPILKAATMDVVNNQIMNNEPPETRLTLERLISQGITEEDAKIYIAQAVSVEIWDVMRNKTVFNKNRFIKNLNNLPEEPKA